MSLSIAFWNINNNTDLGSLLIDFVKENSIDILLLAESKVNPRGKRKPIVGDIILDFLKLAKSQKFTQNFALLPDNDFRVKILSSFSAPFVSRKDKLFNSTRWAAYHFDLPGRPKFNLFPVHFHSKVNWSEFSQALECVNFARDINVVEDATQCENSILIGDFNMNPFEPGLVASNGINAIQDLEYAANNPKGREVDGTFYKYFYNPMWNHFGDHSLPLGTHYYRSSGHVSQEWHMFDQVIIRSGMKPYINGDSVKIITKIAGLSIANSLNRPNDHYSDHFPIILKLNFNI